MVAPCDEADSSQVARSARAPRPYLIWSAWSRYTRASAGSGLRAYSSRAVCVLPPIAHAGGSSEKTRMVATGVGPWSSAYTTAASYISIAGKRIISNWVEDVTKCTP